MWMNAIGAGAALCSVTSFVPQLLKIWREKASEDVSLSMYLLTVTAFSLWSAYGLMLKSWPLLAANLVSLGLSSAILVLQLRYRGRKGRSRAAPARPGPRRHR
jgi:MtN3 and saliva related transmembrane protein